jgi:hypothetical protein
MKIALSFLLSSVPALFAQSQEVCKVTQPTASFTIHHLAGEPELTTDPTSPLWSSTASATIVKDCTHVLDYPKVSSTVRGFWTDKDLYLLFECPYTVLNLWEPPMGGGPRNKLWDRDVVEMFLGDDFKNIRHYREFEIAPTGDWIDLAINLDKESYDQSWRSGWKTMARIDKKAKVWYAAARIPLSAISDQHVTSGTQWRANLYRIEGVGGDPQRHFLCWQPTCVINRDPNHVPENFGTIIFAQ